MKLTAGPLIKTANIKRAAIMGGALLTRATRPRTRTPAPPLDWKNIISQGKVVTAPSHFGHDDIFVMHTNPWK